MAHGGVPKIVQGTEQARIVSDAMASGVGIVYRTAAVSDPGHSGAAMLFGPTVCFKCSATHTTHTPMSFVSLCEKKTVVPAYTPRGYWPSCTLLVMGAGMTEHRFSLVLFVTSAVRQGLS